jgi:Spy/CpxP family protein refolding chaperone
MTKLGVVLAGALLLMPVAAAGQAIFPEPAPNEDATPPSLVVAQGVFDVPVPPPGGPRPGGPPPGLIPRGPRPPVGSLAPGPGAWWKDSETVKKLDLSDAQVGQIEQAYLAHRLRLVDLRADLEKHELSLRPLLDADRPEEAKVAAQIDLITAARGRLEKEHALMLLAVRRTLSVEQWKRLQAFQQERARVVGIGPAAGRPGGPGFAPGHEAGPRPPR